MSKRFLRRRRVEELTGLSRPGIYAAMAAGTFPRQIKIGLRTVAWDETEIDAWCAARIAERDKASASDTRGRAHRHARSGAAGAA